MPDPSTLYRTAAVDLSIKQYEGEDAMDYSFRLVYSMVCAWTLSTFNDRPTGFESSDDRVSKAHVTGTVMDLLASYRRIDTSLGVYFNDKKDLEFVNWIEDALVSLGFVRSGRFSYTSEPFRKRVAINDKFSIRIDTFQKPMKMIGIAPVAPHLETDSQFEDLFLCKKNAKDVFEVLEKTLDFQRFTSGAKGRIEYYDPDEHGFKPYDLRVLETLGKLFLRFDDGAQYAILKFSSGIPYIGYLPSIYSKWSNEEENFGREGWRILSGYCASIGKPLKVMIRPYGSGKDASTLVKKYIWLPKTEEAIMMCLGWPWRFALDNDYWTIPNETLPCVRKLLEHLSIGVEG